MTIILSTLHFISHNNSRRAELWPFAYGIHWPYYRIAVGSGYATAPGSLLWVWVLVWFSCTCKNSIYL